MNTIWKTAGRSDGVSTLSWDDAAAGRFPTMLTAAEKEKHQRCSRLISHTKHCHHQVFQCLFSRLTCLSCLVLLTFLLCLTQEFTYILKFHAYTSAPPSSWPGNSLFENIPRRVLQELRRLRNKTTASTRNTWRRVTEGVYAYSAYWDDRPGHRPFVRFIGGAKLATGNLKRIKCLLRNKTSDVFQELKSTCQVLTENHSKPSVAVYVICAPADGRQPGMVALVPASWNSSWTSEISWFEIRSEREILQPKDIAVCVRPLFNYTDAFRIAEFVAFYAALGVDRFTFYDYASSWGVKRLIQGLQDRNYSVELLPWNLPVDIESMWSLGQIASINDCIYRHMDTAAYVVVVDLDEFITPRHAVTLDQLMSLHDVPGKKFSSFVFRSVVFCSEYPPDTLPDVVPDFVTQSRIWRETKIYPFLVRSKYVVRPRQVVVAGIHHTWELVRGAEERFVPASQVLVHHYRARLCEGRIDSMAGAEIDPIARKYLNRLMRSNAVAEWKDLFRGWHDNGVMLRE